MTDSKQARRWKKLRETARRWRHVARLVTDEEISERLRRAAEQAEQRAAELEATAHAGAD